MIGGLHRDVGVAESDSGEDVPCFMGTPLEIERVRAVVIACRQAGRIYGPAAERMIWEMAGLPALSAPPNFGVSVPSALAQWLSERTELAAGGRTRSMVLYNDFRDFCHARDVAPMSVTAFGRALTRAGFVPKHSHGIWRLGIRLREVA